MDKAAQLISFHIFHFKGTELKIEAKNLQELISEHFADEKLLREKVERIAWKAKSTLCIYNPKTKEIERKISDGDINPYGWRMKHH